ncbi:MAG: putative ABC transporter permease [Oscillibacter sp.]|nr:putative ABC transporter permease [Oscillibacter sp.]
MKHRLDTHRWRQRLPHAALWFFAYSVMGWLYEVTLEVVVYRWGYSDRGVLFGPYCPIYGFGVLGFLLCFYGLAHDGRWPLWRRLAVSFTGCTALATALELASSYLLEWITGSWPWSYTTYRFHYQGRIALSASLRFGLGGVLILFVLHPLLRRFTAALPERGRERLAAAVVLLLLADLTATLLLRL